MSALASFKVLELAEGVAGEYCGKLISDFGADVIKLERPGEGSPTRRMGPFAPRGDAPETSGLFAYLNTNKSSITLDLSAEAGVKMLRLLLQHVDAVIDDHAPGWLREVGLGPQSFEQDFPGLVLCSITPYGQAPPEDSRYAEDINVMHASGWGYHTPSAADPDKPPLKGPGRFLPSYEAGLEAALCVVASLYEKMETGRGRFIDVSKQAVLTSRVDYVVGQMIAGDMDVSEARTAFDLFGPAGIFHCRDGFAYIFMSAPYHWQGLRKLLGEPQWMDDFPENWLERGCTPERVALVRRHLAEWLKTQNKNEAAEAAQKLGVTLVAVNTAKDLIGSPQFAFREFFADVAHPVIGPAAHPTVPYRLSVTPAKIERHAPLLGEHNEARLAALKGVRDE
jgi:crotonobetainyl-CoA:carnitine CoA-transferase CaiB-like acyl-CoA transferase